jgi:large subunit ribosomal protein L9
MKVILTQKVKALGNIGEIVNVSTGHARNFLIPNGFAVVADEKNKVELENQKKRLAKHVAAEQAEAQAQAKKIDGLTLEFSKRIGGNGKIFGTIGATELAKELASKGIEIERRLIIIDTPIKTLGSFTVKAKLFKDVEASFKVKVVIDQNQAEEIKKAQEASAKKKSKKAEDQTEATDAEVSTENQTTEA